MDPIIYIFYACVCLWVFVVFHLDYFLACKPCRSWFKMKCSRARRCDDGDYKDSDDDDDDDDNNNPVYIPWNEHSDSKLCQTGSEDS